MFKLTMVENVLLFAHSLVCDGCRQYAKQSKLIDRLLANEKYSPPHFSKTNIKLDQSVKDKIISVLENK